MRRWAFLVCCLAVANGLSADADLEGARTRLLRGNYAEAAAEFEKLATGDKASAAAWIGWSRALQSQGLSRQAMEVIENGLSRFSHDADLLARQAELYYFRGRWEDAERVARSAIERQPEQFVARWTLAQILRDRGQHSESIEACRWFVRTYTRRNEEDREIRNAEELALVGRAATEYANAYRLTDQFDFILNELYKDALKYEPNAWYIECQAGELLLEKYNRAEAIEAFDKALQINPRAAEAFVGKAAAAMQRFELREAERLADQALRINPELPAAHRLKADLFLLSGNLQVARTHIDAALAVNPRDERTLARLAAFHVIRRDVEAVQSVIASVQKFNPRPGRFFFELAERAEDRRLYGPAEEFFKKAIESTPHMPWPRNGLGLLYMRTGQEDLARKLLDEGFAADRFNVRVANSRKVLKHLESYTTLQTDHYLIRYDPKHDTILVRVMADMLEELYEDYAQQFQYRPKDRILVEVFNNHEMFSGRVVSLPDLHTIGACTGKMFAMVSPKGRGIRKSFNWARVLRHELVHIFNLEQTDMQVPHWLTEGLAVRNERFPPPLEWLPLLAENLAKNEILNLDNMTLAFVRPRSSEEWAMAYFQSLLYVEYILEKYGQNAIGKLLRAYAEGKDDAAAINDACQVAKDDFEADYRRFLARRVEGVRPRRTSTTLTLTQLQAEHEKRPDDPDIAAQLADRLLARDPAKARKLAESALNQVQGHPLASVVLAKLDAKAGRQTEAIRALEALGPNELDPDLLLTRGRLYLELGDDRKAAEAFELGRKTYPYQTVWLIELAKIYKRGDNRTQRISVLADLVATDPDELDLRKLLAQLYLDEGQFADAERLARQALEIDVADEEVHDVLFRALKAQNKDQQLTRLKKLLQE
jgi:tetratricopeptide (TPR) repeat protein